VGWGFGLEVGGGVGVFLGRRSRGNLVHRHLWRLHAQLNKPAIFNIMCMHTGRPADQPGGPSAARADAAGCSAQHSTGSGTAAFAVGAAGIWAARDLLGSVAWDNYCMLEGCMGLAMVHRPRNWLERIRLP